MVIERRKLWALLAVILSIFISFVVIEHSYTYLSNFFTDDWFLTLLVVAVIEVAFISLPYISVLNKRERIDKWLIGFIFVLSIVPATLQTTDALRQEFTSNIIEEPIKPNVPSSLESLREERQNLTNQIKSNQETVEDIIDERFITRGKQILEMNQNLSTQRKELSERILDLENEYQQKMERYRAELREYKLAKKRRGFNSWFDFLKIGWSLGLIAILQLANWRLMHHGSSILVSSGRENENTTDKQPPEKQVDTVINDNEEEDENFINNDDETTPLSLDEILENYKVAGVGKVTLSKFLDTFNVNTEEQLYKVVSDPNTSSIIENIFAHETAKKLKRFCRVTKGRMDRKLNKE